jgi:sugar lactone lactonase YvrE
VKVSPCAQWNKTGITVAGTSKQPGNSSNQLNEPRGIFIRKPANTLYVADTNNNRIQMFALNHSSMMGITVASTETSPYRIYVDDDDDNGPTIYISLRYSNRVEKWINGALSDMQVGHECHFCDGIAVDKEKNVYMTEFLEARVIRWSPKTNSTTIIAGGVCLNRSLDECLLSPQGIYIDKNDNSLYVADCFHDRIQKWPKDAKKGFTVAGEFYYTVGVKSELLRCPNAVLVDEEINMIYIVDAGYNRIRRWLINATDGETIAGRSGMFYYTFGYSLRSFIINENKTIILFILFFLIIIEIGHEGELNNPTDLAFDNEGNLYVCDSGFHRVQMFALIDNRPCSAIATGSSDCFLLAEYFSLSMEGTTTPKNGANSSYENRYNWMITMTIISLAISLWNVIMFK